MEEFFFLKSNRIIWIALLEQKKLSEAFSYFSEYIKALEIFADSNKKDIILVNKALKEIDYSKKLYFKRLKTLGNNLFKNNDYANAVICYRFLFQYDKDKFSYLNNYLCCLDELNQQDLKTDLLKYLEKNVEISEKDYKTLAKIFHKGKEYGIAIEYLEKYIECNLQEVTANDYNLLGCYGNNYYSEVQRDVDILEKSIKWFEKAYEIAPSHLFAKNIAVMAGKKNDIKLQKKYWDEIVNKYKMTNDDKYDYAAFCLKTKNFKGWHEYFDSRFDKENNKTFFPKIDKERYDGTQNLSNSTLLVHCEQGFGDTFLTYGYLSRLQKLAKKVIFVTQVETYDLFKNINDGIEIYSRDNIDFQKIKFDYYLPSMSIPIVLKLDETNISVGGGYIKVKEALKNKFKEKYFDTKKLKIGICYSGNATGNKTRDIPIEEFLPLDNLKDIELYSLNKDFNEESFKIFKNNKINNIAKVFRNFEDTAAAIANLDLIITSDNCILNLAGAMNKKTFALFNFDYEFRWFDLYGDNVVYYDSVKPFVNKEIDNWKSSISRIIEEI